MNKLELITIGHTKQKGKPCERIEPNITEDTIFTENGEIVGFYISNMSKYSKTANELATIANRELRSDRVPKSVMSRGFQGIQQYSTIIGGIAPKPHMRRDYPNISSVHAVKSATNFVKAMVMLAKESENIIKQIMPSQVEKQKKLIAEHCPPKYSLTDMFTSSISNFNISASYHIDNANIKGAVNVIITKRKDSKGGNLTVPDYGATFNSNDNSMIVYPAWRNMHGVTPIDVMAKGGYRNTLIFYPLKGLKKYVV